MKLLQSRLINLLISKLKFYFGGPIGQICMPNAPIANLTHDDFAKFKLSTINMEGKGKALLKIALFHPLNLMINYQSSS